MSIQPGSHFSVVEYDEWPPQSASLLDRAVDGGRLYVSATRDGRLDVVVQSLTGESRSTRTRPFAFIGRVALSMIITWQDAGINVSVNGVDLTADGPNADTLHTYSVRARLPGTEKSIGHPDTGLKCATEVGWRHAWRSSLKSHSSSRTVQAPDRLVARLADSARALRTLLGLIEAGHLEHVEDIAARLRSLVHWEEPHRPSYTPLLFVVAAAQRRAARVRAAILAVSGARPHAPARDAVGEYERGPYRIHRDEI